MAEQTAAGSQHQGPSGRGESTAALAPGRSTLTAKLARRADGAAAPDPDAGGAVDRASSSSGAPLPDDLRGRFETSLGADLSAVRVHTGEASATAAHAIGAKAYAVGNDIHFGAGQYAPADPFGVHLLAHEVAHTQQQAGAPAQPQAKLEVSAPGDAAEVDADRAADAMVRGAPAAVGSVGAAASIAREPDPPRPVDFDNAVTVRASNPNAKVTGEARVSGHLDVALPASAKAKDTDRTPEATEVVRRFTQAAWDKEQKTYTVESANAIVTCADGSMPGMGKPASAAVAITLANGATAQGTIKLTPRDETVNELPFELAVDPLEMQRAQELPPVTQAPFEGSKLTGQMRAQARVSITLTDKAAQETIKKAMGVLGPTAKDKEREKELETRGNAALAKLSSATPATPTTGGGAAGSAPVGGSLPAWFSSLQTKLMTSPSWGADQEEGQNVLRDYLLWYSKVHHGGQPGNLTNFFSYVGRSSQNDLSARSKKYRGVADIGGGGGVGNWCSHATTSSVQAGLKALGYFVNYDLSKWAGYLMSLRKPQGGAYGDAAYAAPLNPGDQVMYLYNDCQYGGHTVTVVDDLGDSFMHVSGNAANSSAAAGIAQRHMGSLPGLNLALGCDSTKPADAKAHNKRVIPVGKVLVYSIVRYGNIFEELGQLGTFDPEVEPAREAALMARYKLGKR